jgi:hypothetical protein
MKTTIEVNGYEITIEEMGGKIMVSAMKDDETVEEFELESEDMEDDDMEDDDMEEMEDDDEMSAFGGEEDDDMEEMEDDDMEEMEDDDMTGKKLESFNHFVRRKK